jgi:hypothetical protein
MWRLLEKSEVPLIGDEVLQSGSLFAWVPVVNNIESFQVGSLVIRRKIEDTKELGATPNRPSTPCYHLPECSLVKGDYCHNGECHHYAV